MENNQNNLNCKNDNSFTTIIYSSKEVNEYIFGCLGYTQDISLVKFNSNFEIESIIYNNKYTINNCESFSIVKLANNKTYSIFFTTQNQNPGILIKNDIPEGIKPSVDEIKKSTSIVKTTSYFVDEITYKTVYSNQISGNSIEFMPDESTSPNIFLKITQNILTQYLSNKLQIPNTEISTNLENLSESVYGKKNSIIKKEISINFQNYSINGFIQNYLFNELNITEKDKLAEDTYNTILEIIEDYFTSLNFDTTNLEKGEDFNLKVGKIEFTLTTSENQKNNTQNNISTIDFGECETLLRNYYNISNESKLYMKKMDITQEGMKIPKIEYDIYSKLNGTNLIKLNLSVCENTKILISVPVIISEDLDKLNISSDYFKDICYISKSEGGTDIILKDRKNEFIEENKTVCQEECDFSDYDYDIQKANCSCLIKESSSSISDMNINLTKLNEKFGNINNETELSNLGITSCNVLGTTENIESNAGFYSLLFILVIFIIIFIIFCCKGCHLLENQIDEVIEKKFKEETKNRNNNKIKENIITSKKGKRNHKRKRNQKNLSKKSKSINSKNSIFNKEDINNKIKTNITSIIEVKDNDLKNLEFPNYKPDTDYEFNWLSYEDAVRYDKRSSCEYYGSLIISKQLFMFTFCSFNDYNSGIIKKFIFFLSFALHYTINALFFNDSNLHQIYEDEGEFNFSYQLPYILSSSIISTLVLRLFLYTLVLTDKDVVEVKRQINRDKAINMKKKKLKCILIKFSIFFILNFVLLVLFWYYLTCFNAVYRNTQIYLIENTFISFGFSLFYPLIINILPMIIRMSSIHTKNKNQRCLYIVSQILQLI